MKGRVLSFGEALVDFLPPTRGLRLRDVEAFSPQVGGAPANLAYGLAKLGGRSGLLGQVGEDEFGAFLIERLDAAGVDTRGMCKTREARTGITFVQVALDGQRSFLFYRHPSADMLISEEQIPDDALAGVSLLHLGTNLLAREPSRSATHRVLSLAAANQVPVSLDVNLRRHMWSDPGKMVGEITPVIEAATLIKFNEPEYTSLFGDEPLAVIAERFDIVAVRTLEERGAEMSVRGGQLLRAPAPTVECIDSTGAGDGFLAGFLRQAQQLGALDNLTPKEWQTCLRAGTFVGATICKNFGACTGFSFVETSELESWSHQ